MIFRLQPSEHEREESEDMTCCINLESPTCTKPSLVFPFHNPLPASCSFSSLPQIGPVYARVVICHLVCCSSSFVIGQLHDGMVIAENPNTQAIPSKTEPLLLGLTSRVHYRSTPLSLSPSPILPCDLVTSGPRWMSSQ